MWFRRPTPDYHRQEEGLCGAGDQADQPRRLPDPHQNPKQPFLRGECVASRREPRRGLAARRRGGQAGARPARRAQRLGARRLQRARGSGAAPTFTPRQGGRAKSQKPRCKLLKIISVLLNIRGRIQRSDLYRRVTRGDFLKFIILFSYWLNKRHSLFFSFCNFPSLFFFLFKMG